MTRSLRSGEKPEQISMRMPKDLVTKVDALKEKEGVDRSAIINKAVRYGTEIEGNITTDHQILSRLDSIEITTTELRSEIDKVIQDFHKEKDQLQKLLGKQQNIIDTLLALLAKK